MNDFRLNNFNAIRLFAAMQVVLMHSYHHFTVDNSFIKGLNSIFELFPGVPIFFFISGFLISRSYKTNTRLVEYVQNRILRIYPALWICFALSVLSVVLVGYLDVDKLLSVSFLKWVVAQLSFFQFYNPEFMRDYGTGVLNGSLWTISVELQFYFLIPIFYTMKLTNRKKLPVVILVFMIINRLFFHFYDDTLVDKLINVSFIPWIYMFLIGVYFQENFEKIMNLVSSHKQTLPFAILVVYVFFALYQEHISYLELGNHIDPFMFLLLSIMIFSFAYIPFKIDGFIKNNDLSYGIYIYHMPVINIILYMTLPYSAEINVVITFVFAYAMAFISWKYIEKPALALKKHPLNPINK